MIIGNIDNLPIGWPMLQCETYIQKFDKNRVITVRLWLYFVAYMGWVTKTLVTVGLGISDQCEFDSSDVRLSVPRFCTHSSSGAMRFLYKLTCAALFTMSPKEKKIRNTKQKKITLSYTAINQIATFTAVDENGRCSNNGI